MGFQCLLVEGDSLLVIKKLKDLGEDKLILRAIITHIRVLEKHFEKVHYLFVPHWINGAAHTLAMEGRRRQFSGIWVDGVPGPVLMIVEKDRADQLQRP
ncbi:hypothetical protein PVK06_021701 [Gossypium arboreum]|uniref:RNase H type-1 domain-containing protein n=1 Tax=Gossypium arboreum TaxID=29729 RepID=A0ABR0PQZ3_GOSAR|nr:hypothetical protein PVK06_021701 [Gossypium arboreum]